jgi:glycosyltransferase involved in cell wall biosynthesis
VLCGSGIEVTVVAGGGEASGDYRLAIVPQLHPDNPAVRDVLERGGAVEDHPLVQEIVTALAPIIRGQDQIWVHNALTVYLNPLLTLALHVLMRGLRGVVWVAFCHDLSSASRYWDDRASPPNMQEAMRTAALRFVVLSPGRRAELASILGIPEETIRIIPMPLDTLTWLDIEEDARQIATLTHLVERDVTFLVPAKLLPHKRIELAVLAAVHLKRQGLDPLGLVTGAPSSHEPAVSAGLRSDIWALVRKEGLEWNVCLVTAALAHVPSGRTVRDLMSLADLVYLPSAEEGYGAPINEAIALRVPLLCSDIPAFRYAAEDYATYTDPADIATTAEHMVTIARSAAAVRRRELLRAKERFRSAVLALAAT